MTTRDLQHGFSLIELLIALIVFSVGLLAVAGLQTVSKQANFEALQRTAASQIAYGLLEDMRVNGDAMDVYLAAGEMGGGAQGGEPAPNCSSGAECTSAQKAAHDLWFWEQMADGNLEMNGNAGAGGLVLPTLCVTGPVGGGAGIYTITIAWRGTASMTNGNASACGTAGGNYGAGNEFRRIMQVPTYIDPTI
ncbi:MAG: type IV pilus modification protein PilV [Gammaproteobacteria bacterium]|jgi:type IV pilus assembly protein PilV|nr:type IV pilus modification protein PilV [Gammaproteobacteria bacterium]